MGAVTGPGEKNTEGGEAGAGGEVHVGRGGRGAGEGESSG